MLGFLFLPYRRAGVSFTSRFMRWHGERLLGRPEDLGLRGTLQDVVDSYYYLAVDRPVQEHKHEFKTWQVDQQHAEEARLVSKAEIPKATFLAVVAVSMICAVVSAPFADWKGSPIGEGASLISTWDVKKGSKALRALLGFGKSPQEANAIDDQKVRADCENKYRAGRFAQSDITLCSSVWNKLGTKGEQ